MCRRNVRLQKGTHHSFVEVHSYSKKMKQVFYLLSQDLTLREKI